MARVKKRRSPAGKRGSGNAHVRTGQVDSTLRTLLVNYMALPPGQTRMVGGRIALSDDARLYAQAIQERAHELGGQPAIVAALQSLAGGKRVVCVEITAGGGH